MNIDKDLIELFCLRDEKAIKRTTEEYGGYLSVISHHILQNFEDVEECMNDVLLKAWETIPPLIPESLKAYLSALIRNVSLDCYRKQHYAKRNKDFQVLLDECSGCMASSGNPEEWFEMSYLSSLITAYLRTMEGEKRYLFVRRYYHGDTIKELARKRGLSESNVKITLYRMRQDLKKTLKKGGIPV